MHAQVGVPPEALGNVTSLRAMEETGTNHNGRVTWRTFESWFCTAGGPNELGAGNEEHTRLSQDHPMRAENVAVWSDQFTGLNHKMLQARNLLCMDCFNMDDLMEIFAEVTMMVSAGRVKSRSALIARPLATATPPNMALRNSVLRSSKRVPHSVGPVYH